MWAILRVLRYVGYWDLGGGGYCGGGDGGGGDGDVGVIGDVGIGAFWVPAVVGGAVVDVDC